MLVEVLTNIIITAFLVIVPAWYASKREIPMKKVFLILWGICATILSGIDLWLLHELEWISLILSGILSTVFNFACFQHPERQKIYFRSIFVLFFFFFASLFQLIPVFLFSIDLNHMSLRMDSYLSLFSNTCLAICLLFLYRHDLKE